MPFRFDPSFAGVVPVGPDIYNEPGPIKMLAQCLSALPKLNTLF
jgi:hypothetical protein